MYITVSDILYSQLHIYFNYWPFVSVNEWYYNHNNAFHNLSPLPPNPKTKTTLGVHKR